MAGTRITPPQGIIEVRGDIRVSVRPHLSANLLWAAEHLSGQAGEIEANADPSDSDVRVFIQHRALVLSSLLSAWGFLEAMVNELFQDAFDGFAVDDDGYLAPLTDKSREKMAMFWRESGGHAKTLTKYQLLLAFGDKETLETGAQPYQDVELLRQLRNHVAHFEPVSVMLTPREEHRWEKKLRGKFAENSLAHGNTWWPDRCLGHGCAEWAWRSALALTEHVCNELGLRPHYRRLRENDWAAWGAPEKLLSDNG